MARRLTWHTFAGGTYAAPGKHSYQARVPEHDNLEYDIDPVSASNGRHVGYTLRAFGAGKSWRFVLPDGSETFERVIYTSPNKAKAAARKHCERLGPYRANVSKRARRYIGRKIRTLAHEGVMAPTRVAIAYSKARKKGFRIPRKRARRNPELLFVQPAGSNMTEARHGEVVILYSYSTPVAVFAPRLGAAWVTTKRWSNTTSRHISKWLATRGLTSKTALKVSQEGIEAAAENGSVPPPDVAEAGVRRNPTLGMLMPNPRLPHIVKVLSGRTLEIKYRHNQDGKLYAHTFKKGVRIGLLSDGTAILWHPSKRIWAEFD